MSRFLFFFLPSIPVWVSPLFKSHGDIEEERQLLLAANTNEGGLRCPFLSPQFIDVLDTRSHWSLIQPSESTVRFAVDMGQAWPQEGLREILTAIGYPKGGASFAQWNTLAVIPPPPDP